MNPPFGPKRADGSGTIGDYYERKQADVARAGQVWREHMQTCPLCAELRWNARAPRCAEQRRLREKYIDAGDTGD